MNNLLTSTAQPVTLRIPDFERVYLTLVGCGGTGSHIASGLVAIAQALHEKSIGIDMLFIDAEKDGYPDYLKKLLPLVRPGGLVLAHNMRWPAPSAEYIEAITKITALETVFVNMDDQGISLTLKKR